MSLWLIKSSFSLAWPVWVLSVHQSLGFCLDRHYSSHYPPTPPPVWLQHFETQLWISEQHHQSQYLLIFIERHASQRHLYNRVIKHLEEMGSDSLLGFFSNAFIVSLPLVHSLLFFFLSFLFLPPSAFFKCQCYTWCKNPPPHPPLATLPLETSQQICMYKYVKKCSSPVTLGYTLQILCAFLWSCWKITHQSRLCRV